MLTHHTDTIIGDVPEDWDVVSLRDVISFDAAGDWGSTRDEREVKVLRSTNFTLTGHLNFSDVATRYLPAGKAEKLEPKKDDLLIERSGGSPKQPVGRVGMVVENLPEYAFSNFVHLLRPNPNKINPRYLGWVLHQLNCSGFVERLQSQSTQMRNLDFRDYLRILIPKPPRPIQDEIVDTIGSVDDAIDAAKQEIEAMRRLKQALMQQLFTRGIPGRNVALRDIVLGGRAFQVVGDWDVKPLGSYLTTVQYGTNDPSNDYGVGYPVVAIPQIVAPRLELLDVPFVDLEKEKAEALRLHEDDVLLIRTNGNPDYIGNSTVVTAEIVEKHVVFASYLIRVQTNSDDLLGRYLNYFLSSPAGRRQCLALANTSAGNYNLSARSIRQIKIPKPDPNEQAEVVDLLDSVEDKIDALHDIVEKQVRLKRSFLQNLLTGEVRIKTEAVV